MSEVVKPPGFVWTYPASVDSVYDGDTIVCHVLIHPGEGGELHDTHVRIEGINAPELNTAAGTQAKDYAAGLLPPGTQVTLVAHKRDKYGRMLGRLILPNGDDFSSLMLSAGQAVPYLV
jgi:micrococcal nuclease